MLKEYFRSVKNIATIAEDIEQMLRARRDIPVSPKAAKILLRIRRNRQKKWFKFLLTL